MITLLALTLSALAQQSAAEIIEQAKQTQKVDNSIQQIRMVLVSKNGAERVRELEMRIRRDEEVLSSYTRFSHPSDVSGTQLIVVDNPDSLDEQLLYLPALKRVQRIAGRARTGAFMGSDFAYEDLEISGVDEAVHALISEDAQNWVIDTTPGTDSSYSRIRTTVSKADYLPRKVEYFDKKGEALKVLTVEETAMDGETVIPVRSVMRNLQKGTSTRMEILEHQLNVSPEQIPDETFTASFMERNG